ncbi:hypothetical protein LO772_18920 [Yinghuangia sp. ASG 101]|uniref:hypothetical protein n=1 Tax=Yinghuangia sp. ASG 101 TaxID=2896848 RepID=UPI001E5F4BF8|nr:hypothetical protein [Yinghuangia sp. ASG 101]UGQ09044.1 hypothetical protein LO772_18920 [Yinghuangia sp. ASG 101]
MSVFYAFGFERIGVVVGSLYFVDPNPGAGQEGAERGVRLEVRLTTPGEPRGSIYAARPITIERPLWRLDLLESVKSPPGSFDRTHHHPRFDGWEPCDRVFDVELSTDPLAWTADRLADFTALLAASGVPPHELGPNDAADLRAATPDIVDATARLLARVHAGDLAQPPTDTPLTAARESWL